MTDDDRIEERLRSALRTVAALPGPVAASQDPGRHDRRKFSAPGRRHPHLLAVVVSVAALAAVIALVVAYGPRNGAESPSRVPATQPSTSSPLPSLPTSTTTLPSPTTTTTAPPVAVGTEQITYEPFVGSQVDPSLHVTSQQSGPCYEDGGGADGRYYYRCIATIVLQPCFAGPHGTSAPLVCPDGLVTTNDVILWTATSVNTAGFLPATTKTPWAMALSNGMVCELVNAAWGGLGPYGCSTPGVATPADCRQPHVATPYWTASCQDQVTDASAFTSVTVEKVWF